MGWKKELTAKLDKYGCRSLYHFTDDANLPVIQSSGGLYSIEQLKARGIVPPRPGGNDWSHEADTARGLHRYVHLCFKPHHPMEHQAKEEGRIGPTTFLGIGTEVLFLKGVLFAPEVSNKSGVEAMPVAEAVDRIDLEILFTRTNWSDPVIQARLQRAEKAEILVPNHIPLSVIRMP